MALFTDARNALRSLLRSPGTTLLAVLVLGLGIGANSAMFSLVNTLLLKPLAIPEPDELRVVLRHDVGERNYDSVPHPDFVDLRDGVETFDGIAAFSLTMAGLGEGADARRAFVNLVSANYFDTFDVPMAAGRAFTPEEARPDAMQPVAILGHQAWRRRGGGEDVLGSTLVVNGVRATVVGVAPRGFTGTSALISPELYMPLGMASRLSDSLSEGAGRRSLSERDNQQLMLIGRLADDVADATATADLARVSAAMEETYPGTNREVVYEAHVPSRVSMSTSPQRDDELAVLSALLLAMSLVVLFVAGFNLAALQDARNLRRRRELSVRMALGSGRLRIVRQLVAESLLLAMGGSLVGLGIAVAAPRLLSASLSRIAPFDLALDGGLDWRVIGATVAFAVLAALIVGLLPAFRASRPDLVTDLKEGREETVQRTFGLARGDVPVLLQLAFSMVLLVSAGLFVKSALRGASVDPGFATDHQVLLEVDPALAGYDADRTADVQRRLRQRIEALPGVRSTALAGSTPFGMVSFGQTVVDADAPPPADGERPGRGATLYTVSDAYFETLDIPVVAGRGFREQEGTEVVIVDELLAERLFGRTDVVGSRVTFHDSDRLEGVAEVVGVVATVRDSLFDRELQAHVYLPASRSEVYNTQIHVATEREPDAALVGSIREAARAVDPALPILTLRSFRDFLDQSLEVWTLRTGARLFSTFAAVALLLAMAGVYGVQAYRIARRTREIGLRMALGATLSNTVALILRDGMRVALLGTTLGIVLAAAAATLLRAVLVDVSPLDPGVLGGAWLTLLLVAAGACLIPARRASRLDPLVALRQE